MSLSEIRANYQRQEAEWEQSRRQLAVAEEELASLRAGLRRGKVLDVAVRNQEGLVLELRREVQRLKIQMGELARIIADGERSEEQDRLRETQERNEAVKQELDLLRREILKSLLGMAELLRHHQRMAQEKLRLSDDLAKLTGGDFGYENYLSCALLHNKDYRGDLQFVVDTIKKIRPVS